MSLDRFVFSPKTRMFYLASYTIRNSINDIFQVVFVFHIYYLDIILYRHRKRYLTSEFMMIEKKFSEM